MPFGTQDHSVLPSAKKHSKPLDLTVVLQYRFKVVRDLPRGGTTECKVSLTEYDLWEVEVDVLPKLPVHMVIGMDIISTGNLSLTYDDTGYTFRFEQL